MAQHFLKDIVYRRLREMIINGTLSMGAKLSESVLAERLDVTKAPIRDALRQLQNEGLVQIKPQSGTFVFVLNDKEFNDLLEFRFHIESKALHLSFKNNNTLFIQDLCTTIDKMSKALSKNSIKEYLALDNDFHETFIRHCMNSYFSESYELISARMATIRNYLGGSDEHMLRSFRQHEAIVDSLKRNDVDSAVAELQSHILPDHDAYWGIVRLV